jgi:hypothetical protein
VGKANVNFALKTISLLARLIVNCQLKKKVLEKQPVWIAIEIPVKKSQLEISTGKFKILIRVCPTTKKP